VYLEKLLEGRFLSVFRASPIGTEAVLARATQIDSNYCELPLTLPTAPLRKKEKRKTKRYPRDRPARPPDHPHGDSPAGGLGFRPPAAAVCRSSPPALLPRCRTFFPASPLLPCVQVKSARPLARCWPCLEVALPQPLDPQLPPMELTRSCRGERWEMAHQSCGNRGGDAPMLLLTCSFQIATVMIWCFLHRLS
jgi:hypothetical protein